LFQAQTWRWPWKICHRNRKMGVSVRRHAYPRSYTQPNCRVDENRTSIPASYFTSVRLYCISQRWHLLAPPHHLCRGQCKKLLWAALAVWAFLRWYEARHASQVRKLELSRSLPNNPDFQFTTRSHLLCTLQSLSTPYHSFSISGSWESTIARAITRGATDSISDLSLWRSSCSKLNFNNSLLDANQYISVIIPGDPTDIKC
jgi:hypothetical protein